MVKKVAASGATTHGIAIPLMMSYSRHRSDGHSIMPGPYLYRSGSSTNPSTAKYPFASYACSAHLSPGMKAGVPLVKMPPR